MSTFEKPSKKMKLSGSDDSSVQLVLSDHSSSSDDQTFTHLKKQLGGKKIKSTLVDLKLVHTIESIQVNYNSIQASCVEVCNKKRELYVACSDCNIRVYDLESRELKRAISTIPFVPVRMMVDGEGEFIVFISDRKEKWSVVRLSLVNEGKIDWEVFKNDSPKGGLIFRKATNEIYVADWEAHKILVLDAVTGSLKYEISNDKTKSVHSLYYDEKTQSLYVFTSLSLHTFSQYNGSYMEKCYLLRLYGEKYENCEVIMEFDEEEYKLNNYGFSSIVMDLPQPYYLISQGSTIYLFDRNSKKLVSKINTEYDECTTVFSYSYNSLNNELYRIGKYESFVEILKLVKIERNFIDMPLSNNICQLIENLGGVLPKEIIKYRYNNEFILSDALTCFMGVKFPLATMFRFKIINNEEEDESKLKDEDEMEDDNEMEDKSLSQEDGHYTNPFPLKYSNTKSRLRIPNDLDVWLKNNADGLIIGGRFDSSEEEEVPYVVKVSESDSDDFPIYALFDEGLDKYTLSEFLSNLKVVSCFDLKNYFLPTKAKYEIDFTKIYNELVTREVINPNTKQIDISILLDSYRKLTSVDQDKHHQIFTICATIYKDDTITFDNTKFRKNDLLVLMLALDIEAMEESNSHQLIRTGFDEQDDDDVFC